MQKRLPWFEPRPVAPPGSNILQALGSESCPGLGDSSFLAGVGIFAWGLNNVAVQEWSDVLLLLPGLLRGSRTTSLPSLLLAPNDKLDQMVNLVQACAVEMGIVTGSSTDEEVPHVVVTSPELTRLEEIGRLVLIHVDQLLDSASRKVEDLVKLCLHCPIGMHFSRKTEAVETILKRTKCVEVWTPQVTMRGVCQFRAEVKTKAEKLEIVCQVWSKLECYKARVAIFCELSETVDWVVYEMRLRGFDAWTGEEVDPEMYESWSSVLVTKVYTRGMQDVINFDIPRSFDEYVKIVGCDRSCRMRVVINIGTAEEFEGFPPMVLLPDDCSELHSRLPLWFPNFFL